MNSSSSLLLRLLVALAVLPTSFSAHAQTESSADIVVSKSGDESVALGGQITYSLTVYNAGPDDAVNIVLTDAIPAHTTFVDASTNTGSISFDGTTLTVNVGTLAFDSTAVAMLVVKVDQNTPRGTIISNTVNGTLDTLDPETSNNSATAMTAVTGPFAGDVLISEFRLRGPAGDDDEFIELYNNTETPIAVATTDGSSGWALAASDGVVRFVIPNGTISPRAAKSGGELLRPASVTGLRKSIRGTMVKTGTAKEFTPTPQPTAPSSPASKVVKVSQGSIAVGPISKLGSLGETAAGKVAKRF